MNDKFKWEVIETIDWRGTDYTPGQIIEDTENGYIKAMVAQGKLKKVE